MSCGTTREEEKMSYLISIWSEKEMKTLGKSVRMLRVRIRAKGNE